MLTPIKEPEYLNITEIEETPLYGIYRCIITHDKPVKLFKFNEDNHYTHSDISVARKYGMMIELIQDDKPNFMYYSKDKLMNGDFLFNHYVNDLYELKEMHVKGAKQLLSVLWGALCETNYYRIKVDEDTEMDIGDVNVHKIYHTEDGNFHIKGVRHCDSYFKTNFGRIKPFVLSFARRMMYIRFNKFEPEMVRIHTDGFYLSEDVDGLHLGTGIGKLKIEYSGNIKIEGLNRITKE